MKVEQIPLANSQMELTTDALISASSLQTVSQYILLQVTQLVVLCQGSLNKLITLHFSWGHGE